MSECEHWDHAQPSPINEPAWDPYGEAEAKIARRDQSAGAGKVIRPIEPSDHVSHPHSISLGGGAGTRPQTYEHRHSHERGGVPHGHDWGELPWLPLPPAEVAIVEALITVPNVATEAELRRVGIDPSQWTGRVETEAPNHHGPTGFER